MMPPGGPQHHYQQVRVDGEKAAASKQVYTKQMRALCVSFWIEIDRANKYVSVCVCVLCFCHVCRQLLSFRM